MNDAMNEKFLATNIETNFLKKKKKEEVFLVLNFDYI